MICLGLFSQFKLILVRKLIIVFLVLHSVRHTEVPKLPRHKNRVTVSLDIKKGGVLFSEGTGF